jgi:hypothetical protein
MSAISTLASIMSTYTFPLKPMLILAVIAIATGTGVYFLISDDPKPETPAAALVEAPVAAAQPERLLRPRTKADAMQALMALPEIRAWSEHLETTSGGTVHGALIEYGPTPKAMNGKTYWQFSFVENTPDAAHRWESFLVSEKDSEILVEDDEADVPLTLEQWRTQKNPMQRTTAN